jgi:hypothetical protein
MAYGFNDSDVIRYALNLDLMSDYTEDDMIDEHVTHEVWTKRNEALTMACEAYDRKEYSVCFAYIKDYFAI